ncbi:MAG: hypothetical protein J0L75_14840 [Spirochaetes bacterium]|nr:hypothetical protein [Spirochaetota bacterium]
MKTFGRTLFVLAFYGMSCVGAESERIATQPLLDGPENRAQFQIATQTRLGKDGRTLYLIRFNKRLLSPIETQLAFDAPVSDPRWWEVSPPSYEMSHLVSPVVLEGKGGVTVPGWGPKGGTITLSPRSMNAIECRLTL